MPYNGSGSMFRVGRPVGRCSLLQRIVRKRTSRERAAWDQVLALMPRRSGTRGIQYDTLELLFSRLYERVSEEEVADHLRAVRGKLQATGDPVKGAINQAIKELQRLPEDLFHLVKIQEPGPGGNKRYVRLEYTRFQDVIGFGLYREYLTDILTDEAHLVLRCVANRDPDRPEEPFPGLAVDQLGGSRLEAINDLAAPVVSGNIRITPMPHSPANACFLLVYEHETAEDPFLGFIADTAPGEGMADAHFILYRGEEKLTKLRFLSRLWHRLRARCHSDVVLDQM